MTTTALALDAKLCRIMGDWIQATCTTAIAATNVIVSTTLRNYDHNRDGFFNNFWVYIEDKANTGVYRQVSDYVSATGTLTVFGAALSTDAANLATFRLTRTNWDDRLDSLNTAIGEVYPALHERLDTRELITGNWLPNAHFENWTLTTVPDKYTLVTSAAVQTTTAGLHRGGVSSVKVTASAGNGGIYVHSQDYPALLDLGGSTVDFKVWAYPEEANDAFIQIVTEDSDGTTQTLTSTTLCSAGKWTQLSLLSQTLNDNLRTVYFKFGVTTNAKYVYFDDARVISSLKPQGYLLPLDFKKVCRVERQVSRGYSTDPCDDISEHFTFDYLYGWTVSDDGTDKYLRFSDSVYSKFRLRLVGVKPFDTLSSGASTIPNDSEEVNLLVTLAAAIQYEKLAGAPIGDSVEKYEREAAKFRNKYYELLPRLGMAIPSGTMKYRSLA